ncbi:hypothetical protein [Chlamydia sp. 17-3921]|uniref:hypothetical protein n=1 Tax=Chlamydia sp. 17-3921 TaxID=2675798 RepID=UPI00191AC55A|nr:hypothetical protein [Chlamydia sp. 17-3921]
MTTSVSLDYTLTSIPSENSELFTINKGTATIQKKVDILVNKSLNTYAFAIALLILIAIGSIVILCFGYYTQSILEIISGVILTIIAITCIVIFASLIEWVNIFPSEAERTLTLVKSQTTPSLSMQLVQDAQKCLYSAALELDQEIKIEKEVHPSIETSVK